MIHGRLHLVGGDITKIEVDAIVNAANNQLLGGGGVDGAIHRAAGPELKEACRPFKWCDTGDARITLGYKLPANYVIHTPGPIWMEGTNEEAKRLESCYVRCMEIANDNEIKTIAFPSISTGLYGYPTKEASEIALRTVLQQLDRFPNIEKAMFVLRQRVLKTYKHTLSRITSVGEIKSYRGISPDLSKAVDGIKALTPAKIISGNEVSQQLKDEMREEVVLLKAQGLEPFLAEIIVGEDPPSKIAISPIRKACEYIDIKRIVSQLPADIATEKLLKIISDYNNNESIHGIHLMLPLPRHIPEAKILRSILPEKDVDCFHPFNMGLISLGEMRFLPVTPAAVIELIKRIGVEISGKDVVILGRSNIVGRPLSNMLDQRDMNATVSMCHTKTRNLKERCLRADIIITAIGVPEFLKGDMVSEGVVVIGVGINRVDADNERGWKLVGDVAFDEVAPKAAAISPVPGGVGPMTIAMLMKNILTAAKETMNWRREM